MTLQDLYHQDFSILALAIYFLAAQLIQLPLIWTPQSTETCNALMRYFLSCISSAGHETQMLK